MTFHSGRQADFDSALCHHKAQCRRSHELKGSAHLTLGDTSGDIEDQEQFL